MKKPIVLFIELKIASKEKYICEIAEKLFHNNIRSVIFTAAQPSATKLNDMLWTFKQDSFIPHGLQTDDAGEIEPVTISFEPDTLPDSQALILFDPLPLDKIAQYSLIFDFAEVYHADKKLQSRKRFKEMRDSNQFDLHFTQLGTVLAKQSISLPE